MNTELSLLEAKQLIATYAQPVSFARVYKQPHLLIARTATVLQDTTVWQVTLSLGSVMREHLLPPAQLQLIETKNLTVSS